MQFSTVFPFFSRRTRWWADKIVVNNYARSMKAESDACFVHVWMRDTRVEAQNMWQTCVKMNRDDSILTHHLFYTDIFCSVFFFFYSVLFSSLSLSFSPSRVLYLIFVVVVAICTVVGTIEVENVCHCKNVALLSWCMCVLYIRTLLAGNKCYYCLPNTFPVDMIVLG